MNYKEIETVIMIDDTGSLFLDGGKTSVFRKDRYKVLFSILRKKLKKVKTAYLILGDGIFELNLKEAEVEFPECPTEIFIFPTGENGDALADKIKSLSRGTNTLLLIDYMLNNLTSEMDTGKKLCGDVLAKLSMGNMIKIPYTRDDLGREERLLAAGGVEYTLLSCFPISSPTDAARYIMRRLEENDV